MSALVTVTDLGPNMTLEDKRKEAKDRLEEASGIEQRHLTPGAPPLEGADLDRVKKLLLEADQLHAWIQADEERLGLVEKTQQMLAHYSKPVYPAQPSQGLNAKQVRVTPGEQFVRSLQYREIKDGGLLNSSLNRLEFNVPLADGTSLLEWKATLSGSVSTSGWGPGCPRTCAPPWWTSCRRSSASSTSCPGSPPPRTPSSTSSRPPARSTCPSSRRPPAGPHGDGRAQAGSTLAYQNVTAYVRTQPLAAGSRTGCWRTRRSSGG
jgi:hypothetical protein